MTHPTLEQVRQWEEEGYLVFENAIQGDELTRLQRAFDDAADACKEGWLNRLETGDATATYYDIPNVLEKDEVFINLVDHPSYCGCLMAFTENDALGLVQCPQPS